MSDATKELAVPRRWKRNIVWLFLLLTTGVAAVVVFQSQSPTAEELIEAARMQFDQGDFESARSSAERALQQSPRSIEAVMLAAGSAAQTGDYDDAIELYDSLLDSSDSRAMDGHVIAAYLTFFKLARPSEAERRYRKILELDPDHVAAMAGLADLLGLTGRRREATPYLIELIRAERITVNQLTLLGSESGGHSEPELLQRCTEVSPDDPLGFLGLGWQAEHDGDLAAAEKLVRRAIEIDPTLVEAHIALGRLLAKRNLPAKLATWLRTVPSAAEESAEVWRIRGDFSAETDETAAAARCYWESIRRNPNIRASLHGLVSMLNIRGEPELAVPFERRLRELQKLKELESFLFESQHRDLEPIERVASQLEVLGRLWESWGWAQFARELDASSFWALDRSARLQHLLSQETPGGLFATNPANEVDLSHFPIPLPTQDNASPGERQPPVVVMKPPRFEDVTSTVDLSFSYENGGDSRIPGQYMYEFSGGGVAAIDFDSDGWPDLYWTQGCRWPPSSNSNRFLDRLHRNLGGRRFTEVSSSARLVEPGFSQGVAVGDFNADGFADVYVANIGRNRLFRNNGDGTFDEASSPLHDSRTRWTTSCLLADLTGDGLPDIYDANYLSGDDLFERMCQHKDGAARMCAPFDFESESDCFLINQGDDTFSDRTRESGFDAPNGKGLGLVAGDFDGTKRVSLFVANDLVPNFYYRNETRDNRHPEFRECGLTCGLAFDHAGRAQGSMGIAAGDLNEDGRLDLFVTNFSQEFCAFYVTSGDSFFRDAILQSGVAENTLAPLGFGAQTIDGNLDGRLDLVITNGHVDDHRSYGRPYQMTPQYFHNLGEGRFAELSAEQIGPFFQGRYLGRGLARLDWNCDGREDFAVSHLKSPASLVSNVSPSSGHSLRLRLVGTATNRDAVGATVIAEVGGLRIVRQVTAGDGYQASNERQLVIGLGDHAVVDRLTIEWPRTSPLVQRLIPADRSYIAAENRQELLRTPPP